MNTWMWRTTNNRDDRREKKSQLFSQYGLLVILPTQTAHTHTLHSPFAQLSNNLPQTIDSRTAARASVRPDSICINRLSIWMSSNWVRGANDRMESCTETHIPSSRGLCIVRLFVWVTPTTANARVRVGCVPNICLSLVRSPALLDRRTHTHA